MIIVTATLWPGGNPGQAQEILTASITNQSAPGAERDNYAAHVLAKPKPFAGVKGYEADIEVTDHQGRDGIAPLLIAVLGQAHAAGCPGACAQQVAGVMLPSTRLLSRVDLVDAFQFEAILRGRAP